MFGGLGHEGHALDSGRTGADDADPLAGQAREIAVGIPAGDVIVTAAGMKTCAGQGFDDGDAGRLGTAVKDGNRVGQGKSVSVSVDLGGRLTFKKKRKTV